MKKSNVCLASLIPRLPVEKPDNGKDSKDKKAAAAAQKKKDPPVATHEVQFKPVRVVVAGLAKSTRFNFNSMFNSFDG